MTRMAHGLDWAGLDGWDGWAGKAAWMDGWAGRAVVTANVGLRLHAGRWIPRATLFHSCGCGLRGIIHTLLATSRPRNPYLATPSSFITPSWTHACEKTTHPLPLTRRHALGKPPNSNVVAMLVAMLGLVHGKILS